MATGQINTDIMCLIPLPCRAFYVRQLVTFIDAAAGRDPTPIPKLPGIKEWKLSSVLQAGRKLLMAEERQASNVWSTMHSQVPTCQCSMRLQFCALPDTC